MFLEKCMILIKTFVEPQCNYCPLIWMLQQALRIVYSDYKSSFNTLLEKDGSLSIYCRNIQILTIMGDALKLSSPTTYNLRTRKEI